MVNQEADRLSDEGMRLINSRRWKEALDALDRSLELDPANAGAQQRRLEAAAGLARGLEAGPRHPAAFGSAPAAKAQTQVEAARALQNRGETEAAIRLLEQAATADPAAIEARLDLGNALLLQGRAAAALAPLREALALQPDSGECRFALARALRWQDDLEGAEAAYRGALQVEPGRLAIHLNLAETLMRRGRTEAVLEQLERAGTACAAPAAADLAGLLERYRWALCALRYEEAGTLGEAVLSLSRRFEHIEALRWPIFTEEFDYTPRTDEYVRRSAAALDAFVAARPDSAWGWYHRSLLRRDAADVERLRDLAPERYGWMRLEGGRTRLLAGDYAGAEAELEVVVRGCEPGDWDAQLLIAQARFQSGRAEACFESTAKAEALVPASHRGMVLSRKGEWLLAAGRPGEALAALDAALQLTSTATDPRDAETRRLRAEAARQAPRSHP